MTEEKGLDGAVADKIGEYVKLKGITKLPQCNHCLTYDRRSGTP